MKNKYFLRRRKTSDRELGLFCHQFSRILSSGIPMIKALEIIGNEMRNKQFGEAIFRLKEMVKCGNRLSVSAENLPDTFPNLFIKMAEVGELSGSLSEIMENLSCYYEKQANLKSNIMGSMIYPILLAIVSIIVVIFLLINVLPTFVDIYETMQIELPFATQLLIRLSGFLVQSGLIIILIAGGLLLFCKILLRQPWVMYYKDQFILKIGLFGNFLMKLETIKMADALSVLLLSGVDLISSLSVVLKIVSNQFLKSKIEGVRENIKNGESFTKSLIKAEIFLSSFYQMVKVGENTGNLDGMMLNISTYYSEEIKRQTKLCTTLLEPVIVLIMGGIVAFIIIAIMMPIFGIYAEYSEIV